MLTPSIGFWTAPLTTFGAGTPAASRMVGTTSMRWGELPTHSALVLDARRPGNRDCGAATAPRGHHFAIVVYTARGVGPGGGNATEGVRAAEFVQVFRDLVKRLRDAVDVGQLVHLAVHTAFGSRAVVANDVDD